MQHVQWKLTHIQIEISVGLECFVLDWNVFDPYFVVLHPNLSPPFPLTPSASVTWISVAQTNVLGQPKVH